MGWNELYIHTKKYDVSVPTEEFVSKSEAFKGIFQRERNLEYFGLLHSIYLYRDGMIRITYANQYKRYMSEYWLGGDSIERFEKFENAVNKDIEQILNKK